MLRAKKKMYILLPNQKPYSEHLETVDCSYTVFEATAPQEQNLLS